MIPKNYYMEIHKNTLLWRASNLIVYIMESCLEVQFKSKKYFFSHHALAILDVFSSPKSFEQGIEELQGRIRSIPGWIEVTSMVMEFYNLGILESETGVHPKIASVAGRFDSAEVHIRMLNDHRRTLSYKKAIAETVKPGDVVLDIGTGTGVLAMMAVMAGAKMVYAVEREPNMAEIAQKNFQKNRLDGRIKIIRGKSTDIDLPEKADVLVSEIVGNDPLGENIIPTTSDAVLRLLNPGAKLIPGRLKIFALPVAIPDKLRNRYLFHDYSVKKWRRNYGIDFSYMAEISCSQWFHAYINTCKTRHWKRFSDPVLMDDIDLSLPQSMRMDSTTPFEVLESGEMSGVLVFFELCLSASVPFSIHPDMATPTNSWSSRLCIPGTPIFLEKGKIVQLKYSFTEETQTHLQVVV